MNYFGLELTAVESLILPIGDSVQTIGRSPADADIVINDERVSRKHCSIEFLNDQLVIEDHSRNGTYVNGRKLRGMQQPLSAEDRLQVASVEFRIVKITDDWGGTLEEPEFPDL